MTMHQEIVELKSVKIFGCVLYNQLTPYTYAIQTIGRNEKETHKRLNKYRDTDRGLSYMNHMKIIKFRNVDMDAK